MSNVPLPLKEERIYPKEIAQYIPLLQHLRKTPLILYGIFVELLRQFYSDAKNIPINTCAVWDPDPKVSGIWIDTEYNFEDNVLEKRPAIYVKLGEISYNSTTGRRDSRIGMNLEDGEYYFSRVGQGYVSFVHIGATKGQTIVLAGATLDYLDAFSSVIQRDFCFESFDVVKLSPIRIDKSEAKDTYHSDVVCAFSFQDVWTLKLESQKLKKLTMNVANNLTI